MAAPERVVDTTVDHPSGPLRDAVGEHWRRNTGTLAITQFIGQFCLMLSFPFIPVFLYSELAIHDPSALAFWNGLAAAVFGVGAGLSGPIWGAVADRFGRRHMAIRAYVGGGATVAAIACVFTPVQFVLARLLCGTVAGTVPAVNALVVAETPRSKTTIALARVAAAAAIGTSLGPMTGGILTANFNIRAVFLGSGLAMCLAAVPILLWTRETARLRASGRLFDPGALRAVPGDRRRGLVALIAATCGVNFAFLATQQLLVVRLLDIDPHRASLLAGFAFAGSGVLTAAGSVLAPRATSTAGYRVVAALAVTLIGGAAAVQATGSEIALLLAMPLVGFGFGVVQPAITTMIGHDAPDHLKATIFGLAGGASSFGIAAGPFVTGMAASAVGLWSGQLVAAAAAATALALIVALAREPLALGPSEVQLR